MNDLKEKKLEVHLWIETQEEFGNYIYNTDYKIKYVKILKNIWTYFRHITIL